MKAETTPPTPSVADELAADLDAANRLADEVFWEVFARRQETLQ